MAKGRPKTLAQQFKEHKVFSERRFLEGSNKMATLASKEDIKFMATKDDITAVGQNVSNQIEELKKLFLDEKGDPKFATKQDVAPVLSLYNNIVLSAKITSTGGKWFYRIVLTLAALFIAWGVLLGGFKGFLASLFVWATPK